MRWCAQAPSARAFHAALALPEYMLLVGGKSRETEHTSEMHAYMYRCNHWFDWTNKDPAPSFGARSPLLEHL